MAVPRWMATTLVVGGSFLAQYLARPVEPLIEHTGKIIDYFWCVR